MERDAFCGGLAVVVRILKAEYNRRSQLKPLLWESTIQLPIEEVYTRLKIVSRRKRDFRLENNEVNMYDIFKDNEDVSALVEGSPGIGKTTFCLKVAHDWAKERIPKENTAKKVLLNKILDYIKDFRYQEKVLIILDGLDELPKKSESHVNSLLHKKILPFCYVLVTSRQEKGIVVRQKVDFDILLQIEGFTEEDAFDYIRKHFSNAGPEHLPTGERLIEEIQKNAFLHALLNNPLNLLLLCVVFEDYEGELPSFRTELYQIIVRCLLRRYCAKHNLEAPDDDKALEKQFEESLLALGELAWRCLQEDRFSFREGELARFESNNKDLAARKLGLVFKEASVKRINPQHEYHFFHKTFQEYLAALYLAHKILKEEVNVFHEYELEFS
ncbi:NACHT, LRR and PYD domains-containing protein 3-like [Oculina patagonica]